MTAKPTKLSLTTDDKGTFIELLPDDLMFTDKMLDIFRERIPEVIEIDETTITFDCANGSAIYWFDRVDAPNQQAYDAYGQHYHGHLIEWEPHSW